MTETPDDLQYLLVDDTRQVSAYRTLRDLVDDIESYDVDNGIYTAWEVSGRRVELVVTDRERELVEARVTDVLEAERTRAALETSVREAHESLGLPPMDTESASTDALIREAFRLQQPPPSLLQRLRDRWRRPT